jgi:hypothetical protein
MSPTIVILCVAIPVDSDTTQALTGVDDGSRFNDRRQHEIRVPLPHASRDHHPRRAIPCRVVQVFEGPAATPDAESEPEVIDAEYEVLS